MAFSTTEKVNSSAKMPLQLVGTANDAPGAKWSYNETVGLALITDPAKIWTEFANIPGAATPALADAAVAANPTILEKIDVHLTLDPTSNNRAWMARQTFGDLNSAILGDWVLPALIRDSGTSSPGYSTRLYNGDPAGAGVELPTTHLSGAGGAPSWEFNYSMGVLVVSTDQAATYAGYDLWIRGYRYIGPTGGTGGTTTNIYTYTFTNQTAITIPHNFNTRALLLKIRDDGTDDFDITGLASTIVYTDLNNVDVTFASPTSGTVVIGRYDNEVFEQEHTSAVFHHYQHAFNKNHPWTLYDSTTFDDLRYAPAAYQFADAEQDLTPWVSARAPVAALVSGLPKKRVTVFGSALSTWTFTHNFNSKDVFVTLQDTITGLDITAMANTIQYNDNDVTVTWATPQAGRLVVGV
jgi:hypothetical protein